jgi:predicted nucleic acid-binding protein
VIVADTNVLVYFCVPGEETRHAEAAYRLDPDWAAPVLWRSEFSNALALYVRKGFLSLAEAILTLEKAELMMLRFTREVDPRDVLRLATESGSSAYDCEFVALAQQLGVPLVTSDRRLAARFRPDAIHLRDFVRAARP